jgi:ABC-type uncharacterized transport system involved in gliding motility auxiliary subunit
MAGLAGILTASNYAPETIALLQGDVPEHCGAVVIAGPRKEYSAGELARLTAYADGGGRLALLLEPDPNPAFADFLRPRGIGPAAGVVIDASGQGRPLGLGAQVPIAVKYPDHPITRGFAVFSAYDGARPLQVLQQPELGGKPVSLAQTSPRSFGTTRAGAITGYDRALDQLGPLTLAAATSIDRGPGPDDDLRLVVFGDSDFLSNAGLRFTGNRDFFLRAIGWLLGEQQTTPIPADTRPNRRLVLTDQTLALLYIINLGVLPLIPIAAGVIVYRRSRVPRRVRL